MFTKTSPKDHVREVHTPKYEVGLFFLQEEAELLLAVEFLHEARKHLHLRLLFSVELHVANQIQANL